MKKSFKILLHIGFWLGYLFLMAIVLFAAFRGQDIDPVDSAYYLSFTAGVAIIPPVFSFYSHYYYLFLNYLRKRKIWLSIAGSIFLSSAATIAGLFFLRLGSAEAFTCVTEGFRYAGTFTFGISTVFGLIGLVIKGFLTWYEELKMKEELIEKTHRMEMALVKSQLDPHFLFNTINNIDILISKNAKEASRYLNQLSDIMRFMLYETKADEIALSQELEYIEKYIQLQKIRTSNGNYVHYEVSGSCTAKKVAPMVFIPFIENAFKHSGNKKLDHAVDIAIQIEEEVIHFSCQNKYETRKTASNGYNGLGNELIKRRLKLLYPQKHSLDVAHQNGTYSVNLSIRNGKV